MEERLFANVRRNHMLDVFRMRNARIVKRDEDDKKQGDVIVPHRFERIQTYNQNVLSYMPDRQYRVGVYIAASPLSQEQSYFELEILDGGANSCIAVGVVPYHYPLNAQPGWKANSVGYHADDGRLYKGAGHGTPFGPRCRTGDRMGCGIRFAQSRDDHAIVFFTRNGAEIGKCRVKMHPGGLHPAVGMHSEGEEVQLNLDADWISEEPMLMVVDHCEDDWKRLHDVRLCGQALEYTGRGKTIHDVGLAQATQPLTTARHYFEMEILDPGESCYIAIGVAKRDYPKHRHPGWNRDSIAYHADDGKVFMGSGIGDPFGPRCSKGDIMGCGIYFPVDYEHQQQKLTAEEEEEEDDPIISDSPGSNDEDEEEEEEDEDEEDDFLDHRLRRVPRQSKGVVVEVFFTRNGKMVGKRNMAIPKGGFFPTVGMLSSCERVRVDLHPVTG